MALQVGDTYDVGGRSGTVEAVESDGTLWVWFGDLREVDQAHITERVPAPPPTEDLAAVKAAKIAAIDARTDALIALGFQFPPGVGPQFSLAASAVQQLIGAYAARLSPYFTYPVKWGALDGTSVSLDTADALEMLYLTAVGTVRYHLDTGQAIKEAVAAASTVEDVLSIMDPR